MNQKYGFDENDLQESEVLEEVEDNEVYDEDVVDGEVDNNEVYADEEVEEVKEKGSKKKKVSNKKKPEIKKRGASGKFGFLKDKKVLAIIGFVAIVFIMGIVKNFMGASGNDDQDYFTVLDTILNSDGGEFSYTITVNSGEHTEKGLTNNGVVEISTESVEESTETSDVESTTNNEIPSTTVPGSNENAILDSTKEAERQKTLSAQTSEWGTKDGIALTEWKYPNYTLRISGECMGTNPYTAKINLVLATPNFSDAFTDIIAKDGTYYINVEQMKYWLSNSKDSYLVYLADTMPDGSKYVQIGADDFRIASRYAEDGEKSLSGVTSMYDYKKQFLTLFSMVEGTLKGYCELGSNSKDGYLMSATGENGQNVANALKSILTKSGDFYDSYISSMSEGMTEDAKTQKDREKDNFISAMQKAMTYMNLTTVDAMNFNLGGNALTLENGDGNKQYEANLNIEYTINNVDYLISITAQRIAKGGDASEEILAPNSSVSDTLMTWDDILAVYNNMTDYFNFTDIELSKQLEPTPQNSVKIVLQNFVDLVNESNCYEEILSINNIMSFLQKYSNLEERNAESENEKACIILTKDFLSTFDNMLIEGKKKIEVDDITGEEKDTNNEVIDENADVEQYPSVETDIEGLDVTLKVDEKKSNSKLLVVDMEAKNNSGEDITLDETLFQVKTMLSSIYPANNRTLLGGYDAEWYEKYEKRIETNFKVKNGKTAESKLYFVISDDNGYMDIWYNDEKLGVVVQY